jgi:hypothetical protein
MLLLRPLNIYKRTGQLNVALFQIFCGTSTLICSRQWKFMDGNLLKWHTPVAGFRTFPIFYDIIEAHQLYYHTSFSRYRSTPRIWQKKLFALSITIHAYVA